MAEHKVNPPHVVVSRAEWEELKALRARSQGLEEALRRIVATEAGPHTHYLSYSTLHSECVRVAREALSTAPEPVEEPRG